MSNVTPEGYVPWKAAPAKRVGLIDADGFLYAAALEGVIRCDGEQLQMLDDSEVYARAVARLEEAASWLGECPTVFVCLSDRTNFRTAILPTYKGNRKDGERPITLDALRGAVLDAGVPGTKVVLIKELEADDVCGIVATSFQNKGYETCIVSPDKDLLSVPGMVLTPKRGNKAPVFSEVTLERADYYHLFQTLTGDPVDNYKGCPGIGPARAEKLLDYCADKGFSLKRTWGEIEDQFVFKGLTPEDALVQARVARILRAEDWDERKKEVILWQPH